MAPIADVDPSRISQKFLVPRASATPLEFLAGETPATHGLTGHEIFEIDGLAHDFEPRKKLKVRARGVSGKEKHFTAVARIDTPFEVAYYHHGGILQYVLRQML